MTRVLRSATRKSQVKEGMTSKLSVSKKSKAIKKDNKRFTEFNSGNIKQNDIWSISRILSKIFTYSNYYDLLKFNTVCKRWNQLTNPFIHKKLNLLRRPRIMNKAYDKRFNKKTKRGLEVAECIANNAKFAPFVKEFDYNINIESQRAIELFETFNYITHLSIQSKKLTQDQFLAMIKPLNQLMELRLHHVTIKNTSRNNTYIEPIQLPSTLTKLTLNYVNTVKSPDLFIQTINSHTNLIESNIEIDKESRFLEPFKKSYPSLKSLSYNNRKLENNLALVYILKFNPQLVKLSYNVENSNHIQVHNIGQYLTNLEELTLTHNYGYFDFESQFSLNFTKPTKIKKLNLFFDLNETYLDSILKSCPVLKELEIRSHKNLRRLIEVVGDRCTLLEKLHIYYHIVLRGEEIFKFIQMIKDEKLLTDPTNFNQFSYDMNMILSLFRHA